MKVSEAEEICVEANVDPRYFSIGSQADEALCIVADGQRWHVFIFDRGERFEERTFGSEDAASVYFLKRLFQLSSAK